MNRCRKLRDKIIGKFVNELRQTIFYQSEFAKTLDRCLEKIVDRKLNQIVCYGLGSFCDGIDAAPRYQLALLILTYEYLNSRADLNPTIEIFDPSFAQLDKDTLLAFTQPRFNLIEDNEHCAREISVSHNGCVLMYMPHLDKYLYNNLLGANWTSERLKKLIVLGNSFREMIDNEMQRVCKTHLYYLDQLVRNDGALVELAVDDSSFEHSDIFNSMALHLIDENWLINNSPVIRQTRLPNWTCVTSCSTDELADW